jgi:hypothetical protein
VPSSDEFILMSAILLVFRVSFLTFLQII